MQTLGLQSDPSEANIAIVNQSTNENVFQGKTPVSVPLKKAAGVSYLVTISKPGYQPVEIEVKRRVSGWYIFGNMVFGGLVGWLIVDPLSGAVFTLSPGKINETLVANQGARMRNGDIRVVLFQNVPADIRTHLVPLVTP